MGMFTTKPPFDLTAFLSEKATARTGGRRTTWAAKPAPKVEEEPETKEETESKEE